MKLAHITQLRVSVWLLLQLVLLMFSTYCKSQCIKGAKAKVRIRAKFSILYECQCQSDVTAYNQNITISVWLQTKCCSGLVLLLLRKRERERHCRRITFLITVITLALPQLRIISCYIVSSLNVLLQISNCSKFLFQISTNGKSQKKHIFAIFKGKKVLLVELWVT